MRLQHLLKETQYFQATHFYSIINIIIEKTQVEPQGGSAIVFLGEIQSEQEKSDLDCKKLSRFKNTISTLRLWAVATATAATSINSSSSKPDISEKLEKVVTLSLTECKMSFAMTNEIKKSSISQSNLIKLNWPSYRRSNVATVIQLSTRGTVSRGFGTVSMLDVFTDPILDKHPGKNGKMCLEKTWQSMYT